MKKKQIGATILAYKDTSLWANENPVFLNSFRVTKVDNGDKLNSCIQHHWPNDNSIDFNKNNNANNNGNDNANKKTNDNANKNTNNNVNNNTNNNSNNSQNNEKNNF